MDVMRTHQLLQFALRQDLGMRSRKREEVVVGKLCTPAVEAVYLADCAASLEEA